MVKEALSECGGDAGAAIEYLIALQGAEPEGKRTIRHYIYIYIVFLIYVGVVCVVVMCICCVCMYVCVAGECGCICDLSSHCVTYR